MAAVPSTFRELSVTPRSVPSDGNETVSPTGFQRCRHAAESRTGSVVSVTVRSSPVAAACAVSSVTRAGSGAMKVKGRHVAGVSGMVAMRRPEAV